MRGNKWVVANVCGQLSCALPVFTLFVIRLFLPLFDKKKCSLMMSWFRCEGFGERSFETMEKGFVLADRPSGPIPVTAMNSCDLM